MLGKAQKKGPFRWPFFSERWLIHDVQRFNRTIIFIQRERKFRTAKNYRFNLIFIFHLVDYRNQFGNGFRFYNAIFKFIRNVIIYNFAISF